jgi:hypothetical protein
MPVRNFITEFYQFCLLRSCLYTSNLIHRSFFPVEPIEHRCVTGEKNNENFWCIGEFNNGLGASVD